MSQLQVFNFKQNEVRTILKDGEPWFVAKDVASILEFKDAFSMCQHLDDDEKQNLQLEGFKRGAIAISESGLYSAILRSRKPEAKEFKRWITHEVIPSIRKTGGYVANDELFINTYLPYVDEQTKMMFKSTLETVRKQNKLIEEQRKEIKEKEKIIQHKEDVIISLVDEVTLAEKRQIINRVVRNGGRRYADRWNALYREFEVCRHAFS